MSVFHYRKKRARQRGLEWQITFEEFVGWCHETNYINLRGQGSNDMTIDRVDPNYGYFIWNIQMITVGDNVRKRFADAKKKKWGSTDQNTGIEVPF